MNSVKPSTRGRPVDLEQQSARKAKLLDAAEQLLAEKSYRSITIRDIAARANTKSAMIGYYFGGKDQLLIALLDRIAQVNSSALSGPLKNKEPIRGVISLALKNFAKRPFMVRLLSDEILQDDSRLRTAFVKRMPGQVSKVLPELIKKEQEAGRIRSDLDPKRAAFSLTSMLIVPFLAAPIRRDAWGFSDEEVVSDKWAEHIYQLFMKGVASNEN